MLNPGHRIAIHFGDQLGELNGKMGHGVLRYSKNPLACVIDKTKFGRSLHDVIDFGTDCPVVKTVEEATQHGAEVMILGMAPGGGRLPPELMEDIDLVVQHGLSVVNGLHQLLNPHYPDLKSGQWIWDIRQEPENLPIANARAASLDNKRLLMIGTDMAVGKMTVGLEIFHSARQRGVASEFLATGQIGMCITGKGIPLDAIRVDYAAGAVEQMVMQEKHKDLLIVEGQGSLLHPGSTSTLPLLRGACPTHLVMCHQAGKTHLHLGDGFPIPDLSELIQQYEELSTMQGLFHRAKTIAVAVNTYGLNDIDARNALDEIALQTGLYTTDVVRYGADKILDLL